MSSWVARVNLLADWEERDWVQAECRRLLQELLRAPQLQASTLSAAYQSSESKGPF
jgi:hypothetical protein